MIKFGKMVPYIGLNKKWSAAKFEATNDNIVPNRKLFISFGEIFIVIVRIVFSYTLTYVGKLKIQ